MSSFYVEKLERIDLHHENQNNKDFKLSKKKIIMLRELDSLAHMVHNQKFNNVKK